MNREVTDLDEAPNNEVQKNVDEVVDEAVQHMLDFVTGLANLDHRSAVILGAARIDVGLERLLKRVMRYHPGGQDNLFGADRPLGSLSAKIALTHRLGLIEPDVEHGLQMIRKMRNDFAHSLETADLSDGPQRNRVRELVRCTNPEQSQPAVWSYFSGKYPEPLAHFCAALSMLLVAIEVSPQLYEYTVSRTSTATTPPSQT